MKKRILPLLCLAVLCCVVLGPLCASAAAPLNPDEEASLTLHYQKEDKAFPDLQVAIYRVAEAFPDGTFKLIEPFSSYPVNIYGITAQIQWKHVAATLCSYITANQVKPDVEALTEEDGTACFTGLKTGLYLVREVVAEDSEGVYIFNQFMVYLPTPQSDGSYNYCVDAKPKCTGFVPKTQYTVTKLWQDTGKQNLRPKEVTVDIYKDGVLYETKILSADNSWSYTWQVYGEDEGNWVVTERTVQDPYTVTIQQNGSVFTIINTIQTDPEIPPKTGDSFTPLPWTLAMCVSGIMLLLLGLYGRRRQ